MGRRAGQQVRVHTLFADMFSSLSLSRSFVRLLFTNWFLYSLKIYDAMITELKHTIPGAHKKRVMQMCVGRYSAPLCLLFCGKSEFLIVLH